MFINLCWWVFSSLLFIFTIRSFSLIFLIDTLWSWPRSTSFIKTIISVFTSFCTWIFAWYKPIQVFIKSLRRWKFSIFFTILIPSITISISSITIVTCVFYWMLLWAVGIISCPLFILVAIFYTSHWGSIVIFSRVPFSYFL